MYRSLMFTVSLISALALIAKGQGRYIDTVALQAKLYAKKNSAQVLFAHLDKNIYVNNETIWFAAYILNPGKNLAEHQIISVGLVNNNTQKVVAEAKYPMKAFAHGFLMIPDTITPGNYSFTAITNIKVNGLPQLHFIQPITIKTGIQPAFTVNITLDTLYKDAVNTRLLLNVRKPSGPLEGAKISYLLGKDRKTRVVGEAKTNVLGSYTLLIPKARINSAQHNLEVQVKSAKTVKTIHFDIPVKKQTNDVRFYPEGGYLVAGLQARVGWEAKTPGGTPIKTLALLFANGKVIDTISTDSYGMGQFYLKPEVGKAYTVKLMRVKNDAVTYNLPLPQPFGVAVHLDDALPGDTLNLNLKSTVAGKLTLLVHNYKRVLLAAQVNSNAKGNKLKLGMAAIPRGINTLTVLDSVGRPLADRMFFAGYKEKATIGITVDDPKPGLRQKMTVKLKLDPGNTGAAKALVSVACVHNARFEIKKENNIENYFYLRNELNELPMKDKLMGNGDPDREYLNHLLLIRGWSKYSWMDMMLTSPSDTLKTYEKLAYTGEVSVRGEDRTRVEMKLLKDSIYAYTFKSDTGGKFSLTSQNIFTKSTDNRLSLFATADDPRAKLPPISYLKLYDPFIKIQRAAVSGIEPEIFDPPVTENTQDLFFTVSAKATNLREVVIKSGKDMERRGANECGDYVCVARILNCLNHVMDRRNRPPVVGETLRDAGGGGNMIYEGCNLAINTEVMEAYGVLTFRGVFNSREHYGSDYTKIDPLDTDYLSTVMWKHDVVLSTDKETELTFYTSDITGKFRIVVQGVTDKDVIYSETLYEAVAKKDK